MSRYVDIDRLEPQQFENSEVDLGVLAYDYEAVQSEQYIDIVRCKDCMHNPKYTKDFMYGVCVCTCEDDWYSYEPEDNFFCGWGERREE